MYCFKISSYNAKERIKRQITAIRNTTSCHKSKQPGPAIQKLQDPGSSKVPSERIRVYEVNPSFTLSLLFWSLISIIWNSMKRYVLCCVPYVATISTNAPVWHFLKTCLSASTLKLQRNTCENLEIPRCEFSK